MSSGGGGGGPTTSTVNQNAVPEYAQPYFMQMLGNAGALTMGPNSGYQAYTGQRQADLNPMQTQALGNLQQMQPSSQTNQATGMAGLAGLRMGQMAGQNNNFYDNTLQNFTGSNVDQYMSPYMNDVVAQQKNAAIADYARNLPQLGADAARVGGLGGTRSALMQAEGNRNLQGQLQGIQATGSQNAFQNAQQQFNAQQQARMQNAQNQAQYGLAGQQFGLSALQGQLGAANQLGQLGMNQYQQQSGINNAQMNAGNFLQGQSQNNLNNQYQDYLTQQQYPYTQLQFMNSLIHGLSPNTQTTVYGGQPNQMGQIAGLGMGVAGLSNLWG